MHVGCVKNKTTEVNYEGFISVTFYTKKIKKLQRDLNCTNPIFNSITRSSIAQFLTCGEIITAVNTGRKWFYNY